MESVDSSVAQQDPGQVTLVAVDALSAGDSPRLAGTNADHVRALAETTEQLPPILVHRPTMRVIDGMHRLRAAILRGDHTIEASFFDGDDTAAFVLAVQSNISHGLPLTHAERTAAARRIVLARPYWSDRMIAGMAGLSPKTVGAIRARSGEDVPRSDMRLGRDGKLRKVRKQTGRRERPAELPASDVVRGVRVPVPLTQHTPQIIDHGDVVRALRNDPTLRFSETGRLLLRLLDLHSLHRNQWDSLVASVPPHWAHLVADIARECADAWRVFADGLEQSSKAG